MAKFTRTPQEVRHALDVQMNALAASVRAYENGAHWEAARIAVATANLIYSKGRTVGILDQLAVKSDMPFMSTGFIERDGNYADEHPLVGWMKGGVGQPIASDRFETFSQRNGYAALEKHAQWLRFEDWWSKAWIYKSGGWINPPKEHYVRATVLTRSDVVLSYRNQDGGAHYDDSLSNETYARLVREGSGCSIIYSDGSKKEIMGLVDATMAQIGHELTTSVLSRFPDISRDIGVPK